MNRHRVDKVTWELDGDGKLWARARLIQRPATALAAMNGLFDLTIKRHRKARSLDANAYCWALCEEIAKVIFGTKEEVYRTAIRQVGVLEIVAVKEEAVPRYIQCWEERGIGWTAEDMGDTSADGWHDIMTYYGSSSYDSGEMARLIDFIVEEAKALGIETKSKRELDALMEEWNERQKSKAMRYSATG